MSDKRQSENQERDRITIRFTGDSGDGMQLTGGQFTNTSAAIGNDVSTLPDYPAEIRAPAGSLAGVSVFQMSFSNHSIHTPGDKPDVLVAMNPAALKVHVKDLDPGDMIVVNQDAFTEKNLKKAEYDSNPLEDDSLKPYTLFKIPISSITARALEELEVGPKQADRSKNFFALGFLYWMFNRPLEATDNWIEEKFGKKPLIAQANRKALSAGYNYGETTEAIGVRYTVKPAKLQKGEYRTVTGNEATALGLVAAAERLGRPLFYGSYPITPASEILQELSALRHFGVKTFQAEDEIAAMGATIGAAFAGSLGATGTSGPGVALKSEAIGLAVITELPVVIVNVQRGGPSTGLPTKTEQADLLQAMYGRNGECPVPVLSAASPADCFNMAIEAARIAVKYMTPVFLLTDGYVANGSEPWRIPDVDELPKIEVTDIPASEAGFQPYLRDPKTLSRPWVSPGTAGSEHRIGGLEKADITGEVSYDSDNHHHMIETRAKKIAGIANDIPDLEIYGDPEGEVLVLGWGMSFGVCRTAVERGRQSGLPVSHAHLRYINPFPKNTGDVLARFKKILIPEINLGQLRSLIRQQFLINPVGYNKVRGLPLQVRDIEKAMEDLCNR